MSAVAYRYRALDARGVSRKGTMVAVTAQEAYRKLTATGLTPIEIAEPRRRSARRGAVNPRDLAHFTSQLSTLMGARIPIASGLRSIAEQERDDRLRTVLTDLAARIESGEPVAEAMSAHTAVFGEVYVESIRAAERSGNMIKVLDHLAEMLEQQSESSRQVRGAFMYPACVAAVLAVGVTFLVVFVIPKFADMFAARGVQLPMLTRVLMAVGHSAQAYWWVYLGAIAAAVAGWRHARHSRAGRAALSRVLHALPVVRDLMLGLALARFARVFGLTLSSGLPMIECLSLAGRTSGSVPVERDVERLCEQVRHGGKLSEKFPECETFTPFAKRMLAAGEESAELPRMCAQVAAHFDRESRHLAKTASTLVEPLLVVMIAMVVLVVALAIFLPMWDMVSLVK